MIKLDFAKMGGLLPAVIQDFESGEVLMVAFMDEKTLNLTLESGKTWFFSRSRNKYWMKGEESGNTQEVKEILTDCPRDFRGLMDYLRGRDIEGVVWHHPDGRMAKLKGTDFGRRNGRPDKRRTRRST